MKPVISFFFYFLPIIIAFSLRAEATESKDNNICLNCHDSISELLPEKHPELTIKTLERCMECHSLRHSNKKNNNAPTIAAQLHTIHLQPENNSQCTSCHAWECEKSFTLIGVKTSLGAPTKDDIEVMQEIMGAIPGSGNIDEMHMNKKISCSGCHGSRLPRIEDNISNVQCLTCHGPKEKLITKTAPEKFADRNPHKSHLGEIACSVCHVGHMESRIYCLECHPKFNMTLPSGSK
ncbi:MAG: hypothetical protein CSB23_05305 [Deltaproteobacteria bacterium]|nr:MAG: hypothetical protein CSB23_05305 [Deltaproteobacteria bacterium]